MNLNNCRLLSGDASFRKFYRTSKNSIIVYCKKNKFSNLVVYDAINRFLNKNKIKAPKLKREFYQKNYIEIEDLGDNSIIEILKKNKVKDKVYLKILKILKKIQNIKSRSLITFQKKKYILPIYSKSKLLNESKIFLDWYLPKVLKKDKFNTSKKELLKIFINLYQNLKLDRKVFVHRDFHASNMMYHKKKIYIIDTQDAVYGNIAYDLASLIDDVRFRTSIGLKDKIFKMFTKLNKSIDKNKLKNDFEILSVLRNLKIIGIFTRLAVRDGKKQYMKMIPYAWKMIEHRVSRNYLFKDLEKTLNKYVSKKIRLKKWK